MSARPYLVAFLSGAAYEACSVAWVHQATRGHVGATAALSGLQALAQVAGIGESVRQWRAAPCFVIGYALGAAMAMVWT